MNWKFWTTGATKRTSKKMKIRDIAESSWKDLRLAHLYQPQIMTHTAPATGAQFSQVGTVPSKPRHRTYLGLSSRPGTIRM